MTDATEAVRVIAGRSLVERIDAYAKRNPRVKIGFPFATFSGKFEVTYTFDNGHDMIRRLEATEVEDRDAAAADLDDAIERDTDDRGPVHL